MTKPEWQGPRTKATDYYFGDKFVRFDAERYGNGVAMGKRDKLARRALRGTRHRQWSRIARDVRTAALHRLEYERLATNSHEAKRYVAAALEERAEKRRDARHLATWFEMWGQIGAAVESAAQNMLQKWFKNKQKARR